MITVEFTKEQYDIFSALWENQQRMANIQGHDKDVYTLQSDLSHCKNAGSTFIGLQEFQDKYFKMHQCNECQTTFVVE